MSEVNYLPLIQDMTWSYSRIESYESCPYKFFLKYIHGSPDRPRFYAEYGSFMHRILEKYYRGELTKENMVKEFLLNFSTEVKGDRPKDDIVAKYIQKGCGYLKSFEPFPYKMIDVEKKVRFTICGYEFVGFIDFLGEDDEGNLVIVDNKSRDLKPRSKRKSPTLKDKELDDMLKQLYIYSSAINQEFGKFPTKLCFNCFKSGVFIEEPFNEKAYDDAVKWAIETIRCIEETEDFYPSIEYFACNYLCGVSDDCIYCEEYLKGVTRGVRY